MTRLKEKYTKDVVPALTKEFGYKNVMVPQDPKIVVNMARRGDRQRQDHRAGADEPPVSPARAGDARSAVDRAVQGAQGAAGRTM
jgi:hypothetical protein